MGHISLPANAEIWELSVTGCYISSDELDDAIKTINFDKSAPPSGFLPFMVWEYGLGKLTPYVPNLYSLLSDGIVWQRVRGTPDAVAHALSWLNTSASIEQAWHGRTWWNSFQLRFDTLPENDDPLLERIEAVTALSVSKRSQLRRGVHHYDAACLTADYNALDNTMLDRESGIQLTPAGTIWSFGRTHIFKHELTEAEGLAIGNWIDLDEGQSLRWIDMTYPWVQANFPWEASAITQRKALLAGWFNDQTLYVTLKKNNGDVIGYRRCRACHSVSQTYGGSYSFDGVRYQPRLGGTAVYIEALTDFDDAKNVDALSISLLVGGVLREGVKPGCLWLEPQDISGGHEIAHQAITLNLRASVREQFKFMVRF